MGGIGSGRPRGYGRDIVEECRALDVNRLHRDGCLRPGWRGSFEWRRDGDGLASIALQAEEGRLILRYNYRCNTDEWQSVEETISVEQTPCRYGGTRPYFRCPGVVDGVACKRRVSKLYGPGKFFLCRHCYRLAYASQSEGPWDRALRRGNKIRRRLGGDPGMAAPFPPRPKGMWRRTYAGLRGQAQVSEMIAERGLLVQAERFLAQMENRKRRLRR